MAWPPPDTLNQSLSRALDRSEPLAVLLRRLGESRERFEAIRALLPPAMLSSVRAGPLDDTAWAVLVDHAAAAAKLRQMLPDLQSVLAERGWAHPAIKIKIQPRP